MKWMTKDWTQGQLNALVKKIGGDEIARGLLSETVQFQITKPEKSKLLELVATIDEIPVCERFVAADKFRPDLPDLPDINLLMSKEFQETFLGKVEENIEATMLRIDKLLRSSRDLTNGDGSPGIIAGLGGKEETTLYHLFTLLMKQANGEDGDLLTDGSANIFYISDINGELWAVFASRGSGRWWSLRASSVENTCAWSAGYLVVSREVA